MWNTKVTCTKHFSMSCSLNCKCGTRLTKPKSAPFVHFMWLSPGKVVISKTTAKKSLTISNFSVNWRLFKAFWPRARAVPNLEFEMLTFSWPAVVVEVAGNTISSPTSQMKALYAYFFGVAGKRGLFWKNKAKKHWQWWTISHGFERRTKKMIKSGWRVFRIYAICHGVRDRVVNFREDRTIASRGTLDGFWHLPAPEIWLFGEQIPEITWRDSDYS